ncbi:prolyl oligopeptidase family serine peptidase [Duganella sp. FT92W]|uniref:Prolyl oligopeptidase family serine peptidase n=2 Tax=Pseudoduganella rivuli TaxID=2666085 RepID=A0A7X2IM27_9BURK|nr:prolyl oligopeptidase family serine peptidase [Pseudoduganella rivuli]
MKYRSPLLALCALALTQFAMAAPPTEYFFDAPEFSGAKLSPTARYLAVRAGEPGKRQGLAVIDLDKMDIQPVIGYSDVDIGDFQWINSERLVYDTADRQAARGSVHRAPGLFAINRDGSRLVQLAERDGDGRIVATEQRHRAEILPWNHFLIPQQGTQETDWIYVINPSFAGSEIRHVDLKRVHTFNGAVQTVPRPQHTKEWLLDFKGEPRLAMARDAGVDTVHYRDPATDQWRVLASFNSYTDRVNSFSPLGFGANGKLYATANMGRDKASVYTVNLDTGKVDADPKISSDDYDVEGDFISGSNKLLGVRLTTDAATTTWFDAGMQAIQKAVDALLPDNVNLISVAARPETPWVLVESYSDVMPRTYLVYNTATRALKRIGGEHPRIDPAQMGRQQTLRYTARDGLSIPATLTLPPGVPHKNLPLVVLVHGGPYVRGNSWGWEAHAQFLATRGYAVLEPEYRGSTGYGYKHFRAGWKQWGLAMQDDIADGAKWAIAQGIADPKRICIAGASYGGYAALMGLVNDSDLYRCGINWVGVTDIGLLYNGTWTEKSDISDHWRKYGMPELVGDQVKDAAQLKATSPLHQAARIKQPLLLAYGGSDDRVPMHHGKQFYDAVKNTNQEVEWVLYPSEGHGWKLQKTHVDFWDRVERFLARHIGPKRIEP